MNKYTYIHINMYNDALTQRMPIITKQKKTQTA